MGKYDYLVPGKEKSAAKPSVKGKYSYLIPKPETVPQAPAQRPQNVPGVIGGAHEVVRDIKQSIIAPAPKRSLNPFKAIKEFTDTAGNAVANTIADTVARYKKSYNAYNNPKASFKEKAVAQGELTMGLVNVALAPVTASLQGAEKLPSVLGSAATVINRFFGVLGTVGSDFGEGAVAALPVSDKTKALITPLAQEVGALVAQVAAGKGGLDNAKLIREKSVGIKELIDRDVTHQMRIASDDTTYKVQVQTPKSKHEAYARSMGYEPYMTPDQLPIIQMGGKPTSALPTIQIDAPKARAVKGDLTIEPIKPPTAPVELPTTQGAAPNASQPVVVRPQEALKPVATETGIQAPNTRAQTLERAAVERKLTDSLGELPTHERIDMKEQANRAMEFVDANPDSALRVIRGEAVPDGVLPEAVYTAMEVKAIKEGNVEMLKELSNSTIPTTAGQAMKALDSADPNSPVKIMRDIQEFREAKLEEKTGRKKAQSIKNVVEEIRDEVKRNASKRPTWEQFMQEITCK